MASDKNKTTKKEFIKRLHGDEMAPCPFCGNADQSDLGVVIKDYYQTGAGGAGIDFAAYAVCVACGARGGLVERQHLPKGNNGLAAIAEYARALWSGALVGKHINECPY